MGRNIPGSVPESVPQNRGVRRSVPCPALRSVQLEEVSQVSRTLWGHSRDTYWTLWRPGRRRAPDTPWDTPSDAPVFGDTLRDTPWDTQARRAREIPVAGRRDASTDQ